jgi:hypothetical protein
VPASSLTAPSACARELLERGFVHLPEELVGEFTVPPAGALRREFQTSA